MSTHPFNADPDRREANAPCSTSGCSCSSISRRDFIKITGLASATLSAGAGLPAMAGPFEPSDTADHFVPADKKLKAEWLKLLFDKGRREFYSGESLRTIGMPIGGISTGQLYMAGDGRLVHWDIFNQQNFSGTGETNYDANRRPESPVQQGFAMRIRSNGKTMVRTLDHGGFPDVRFCGEYPLATVEYPDAALPLTVRLEAFSPFIPLHAADSALPATLMQFTLKNTSSEPVEVTLAGWLQNGVCGASSQLMDGVRRNRVVVGDGWTMVVGAARPASPRAEARPPIVLADFEGGDYGSWTASGEAFGKGPAEGTLQGQQEVSGYQGKRLVNTFLGGDLPRGRLASPTFKIERSFLSFLIGGGNHKGKTCVNLLVDGKVARTAEGKNNERLEWCNWDVRDLAGKDARIEIVDEESAAWGHINVDQIEMADRPRSGPRGKLEEQPDFGSMGLALLDPGAALTSLSLPDGKPVDALFDAQGLADADKHEKPLEQTLCGAVGKNLSLAAGQEAKLTFVVAWHFPNRPEHGNFYATRFADASAVVGYIAKNFDRLSDQTRRWHATWYDSTLPRWLLDRLFSTVSTLATGTCQWWANGRFWAWEGVGCCHGTCAHVWNYEHAMARLFPELERSVRVMQDYGAGFVEQTGMVRFRGENWDLWAGDSQPGTVLKAYREHQISANSDFLRRLWPKIRKSMEFMIREDANADGLVEGRQHNTYDIDFYGPNTMVGSLYLAALRAAEAMAREVGGQDDFAAQCRKIFESGRELTVKKLFNGEYFVQSVDLKKHPKFQYGDGCLADQCFGQGWAHQVGLGYIYPENKVRSALKAIWAYNWAPDVGPQNKAHAPQRWFARPGEAGLLTCTWPKSKHLGPESVLYRDEVWTGIEYQVAGHMVWEGMLTEALAICRAIHDRYHPAKRNPWNEIECGDHYARGMASHGVFLALCGFEYHGPKGHLGFAPRMTPEDFRGAFTASEGWGTFSQKRVGTTQTNRLELHWGKLRLQTLALELPRGANLQKTVVALAGQPVDVQAELSGRRVILRFHEPIVLNERESLEVSMTA
jgi:uncharacterized protein (DUF608 family)